MPEFQRKILITGGAGFIGSNLLQLMVRKYPRYFFVNLDKLTYAGNLANLREIESFENYRFVKGDICDRKLVTELFEEYGFDGIINLAAESHVDRSILTPAQFVETNVMGTFALLEACRQFTSSGRKLRFHHVSTDEVFGSLGPEGYFREESPYVPSSPYAASKASGDHFVQAYHKTYGLDAVITNCSNNYGPYQFPEKLIPLIIHNGLAGEPLPIYGDGSQIRDWLYVADHCEALDLVFHRGKAGQTYNIGGNSQIRNVDLVKSICRMLDEMAGKSDHERQIRFVEDRPGHDQRYAIDCTFIQEQLGWKARFSLIEGLRLTVKWYLENQAWVKSCLNGEYKEYYQTWYSQRLKGKEDER